ncbi:MAG TPA: hypothetical protein VMB35_05940 [Methanomicrobiales archaeon]|nr:hypothetical protein [Methanomicrobiales archaeon]
MKPLVTYLPFAIACLVVLNGLVPAAAAMCEATISPSSIVVELNPDETRSVPLTITPMCDLASCSEYPYFLDTGTFWGPVGWSTTPVFFSLPCGKPTRVYLNLFTPGEFHGWSWDDPGMGYYLDFTLHLVNNGPSWESDSAVDVTIYPPGHGPPGSIPEFPSIAVPAMVLVALAIAVILTGKKGS